MTAYGRFGLTGISVACVREQPSHAAELGTQVLMGMPVEIVEQQGGWFKIITPDGYRGYIISNSLVLIGEDQYNTWKSSPRVVYCGDTQSTVWADSLMTIPVSDIVPGSIVKLVSTLGDWSIVQLPDGRSGYLRLDDCMDIEQWASQSYDAAQICDYAKRNIGVPYLWGGTSSKSMDCSGLTWTAYWLNGRLLPRNASAQAKLSKRVPEKKTLAPGNLVFYGNCATRRVNHVAIALDNDTVIESAGRVRISALKRLTPEKGQGYLHSIDLSRYPSIYDTDEQRRLFFNE